MFDTPWKHMHEEMQKAWETSAARWWDQTLRAPETLEQLGKSLGAACAAKERSDQALEQLWSQWRLPSSTDLERLHERVADLDDRFGRIESLLEKLVAGQTAAAAKPATPKAATKDTA
jgi:hypothetical protein